MATTIQQTSLNVSINESISINGVSYGNNISKSFAGNGKVDQRVMEINSAAFTSVFGYENALPDKSGTGVKSEFTYFRITNTDSSVGVTIELFISATKRGYFHLASGTSLILMGNDMDFECEGEAGAFTLADLVTVNAKSDLVGEEASTAYVEYVAVFKGGTTEAELD